jgi:hypothetical protein
MGDVLDIAETSLVNKIESGRV